MGGGGGAELNEKLKFSMQTYLTRINTPFEYNLVVRALERYSKDPGSSPGRNACFSH